MLLHREREKKCQPNNNAPRRGLRERDVRVDSSAADEEIPPAIRVNPHTYVSNAEEIGRAEVSGQLRTISRSRGLAYNVSRTIYRLRELRETCRRKEVTPARERERERACGPSSELVNISTL